MILHNDDDPRDDNGLRRDDTYDNENDYDSCDLKPEVISMSTGEQQILDHLAVRKFRISQVDYWVTHHKVQNIVLMSKCLSLKTLLPREKFSRYASVYTSPKAKLFLQLQYRLHVLYFLLVNESSVP
jgi:hypothetical protein